MRMLKTEWLKIRKYRAFLVLFILAVCGVAGANYIAYSFMKVVSDAATTNHAGAVAVGNAIVGSPFAFPDVYHTVAYIGSFLHVLPGLLIILLVSNEFNFRTHRQNVIDGVSRTQFISTKIVLSVIFASAMTMMALLTACLFGAAGDGAFSLEGIKYIGYFFVQSLEYMSAAMVLAVFVKRAGIGIGLYFIYTFIVENILSLILNHRIYAGSGYFLPLSSADELIPVPTTIGKLLRPDEMPGDAWLLLTAVAWIALIFWLCKRRFEKADL